MRFKLLDGRINDTTKPYMQSDVAVREVLDMFSTEFQVSELSTQEKLQVIEEIGFGVVYRILEENFANKPYSAFKEANTAYEWLKKNQTRIKGEML
jgi:hypothetical protein